MTSDTNFPDNPDSVSNLASFEAIANAGENFGQRISGLLSPPQTGPYSFYIAGDESAELWISNTADPNQKQLIASATSATGVREWTATASQKSQPVYLAAGQQYYIEALHKEATGADHLAVGWRQPTSVDIEVITGEFLAPQTAAVRIYSDLPNVAEGAPSPSRFTIVRSDTPLNNSLTVAYQLSGDATNGVDYSTLSGTITIPAGQQSVSLVVDALSDALVEGDESVIVELKSGSGYDVGFKSERTAYGKIQDDVAAPSGGSSLVSGTALGDFSYFGGTFTTVNDPIEGDVIQAVITGTNDNPWNAQLKQDIAGPVQAGDILLLEFKVRSVGADGFIAGVFEKSSTPYTKSLNQGLPTTDDWMKVQIPFLAAENYAASEASFGFFLAYGPQTVRLTDFVMVNYGPQKSLAPETAFDLNNIGGTFGTSQTVPVSNKPFELAFEVETTTVPDQVWHLQAVERNEAAVPNGDTMRFAFSVRATAGSAPETNFAIQRTDTYATLFSQSISLTSAWQDFTFDVPVTDDFGINGLQAVFNLGHKLQTVEIGGFHWTNESNLFDLDEMPRQFPASSYGGRDGVDPWRDSANDRIDSDRKSQVAVNVNDINGNPLSGAVVSLRQTNHEFKFGSAINAYNAKLDPNGNDQALKYQSEINRLFNTVVFENSLKWPGYAQDPQRAIDGVNWAESHDLYIRGHNIIWPSRTFMPTSIWSEYDTRVANDGETLANAWLKTSIEIHFDDVLVQFDGKIPEWDVVNEPFANHDVMDIFGDQILLDWFQRVRDYDPTIQLTLNDYHIFTSNGTNTAHRADFDYWLGELRDLGLLDVIGEQSHYNDSNLTDIGVLAQLVTSYSTQFNAPVAITEFDMDSNDEQLQADYLRDYMTMTFSQTAVSEFLHWGFWENSHWLPDASLYRNDFSIKPNGQAYEDLVFGNWWSDVQGTTRDGSVTTGAFLGEYDVVVQYNGQTYTSTVTVDSSGNSAVQIDLPVEAINYDPLIEVNNPVVSGAAASNLANDGVWVEPDDESVTLSASLGDATKNTDGTWDWNFVPEQLYQNQLVTVTATDARGGTEVASFTINAETSITTRGVSYGGSSGFSDNEIAINKSPLLPGNASTFDNFTSYHRGLNRVIVDVAGLASSNLTAVDFEFRVGNTDVPSTWDILTATSDIPLPTIDVSDPVGGISQIKLSWPDNAIENAWLRVTVKSNANTGMAVDDRFFFGNQIGEVIGDVNTENNRIRVNSLDTVRVRLNRTILDEVPIENLYDIDRNGTVNSLDTVRVRLNRTTGGLLMFTAPVGGGFTVGGSFDLGDGGTNDDESNENEIGDENKNGVSVGGEGNDSASEPGNGDLYSGANDHPLNANATASEIVSAEIASLEDSEFNESQISSPNSSSVEDNNTAISIGAQVEATAELGVAPTTAARPTETLAPAKSPTIETPIAMQPLFDTTMSITEKIETANAFQSKTESSVQPDFTVELALEKDFSQINENSLANIAEQRASSPAIFARGFASLANEIEQRLRLTNAILTSPTRIELVPLKDAELSDVYENFRSDRLENTSKDEKTQQNLDYVFEQFERFTQKNEGKLKIR